MRQRGIDKAETAVASGIDKAKTAVASGRSRLEAIGVSKLFGHVQALDGVDLEVLGGEIHVLAGENGAGKSTLVSLLNGSRAPDAGRIVVDGHQLEPDPAAALAVGVVTMPQDLSLVPSMTGLENIALAVRRSAGTAPRQHASELAGRYGVRVELSQRIDEMEMPARQRLALLRALCQRPRMLLLDEPTTFLPPTEISAFLATLRSLAADGVGILLITHRIEEVRAAADRGTILRQGKVVANFSSAEMPSHRELAALIAGHEVRDVSPPARRPGATRLEMDDLEVRDGDDQLLVDGVRMQAAAGSILGLAGVDGNGQEPLLLALAGFLKPASGRVLHAEVDVTSWSARRRMDAGIRSVPSDRSHGIVRGLTLAEHFRIAGLPSDSASVEAALERYGVRPAEANARADRLSGGNQQKLQLALAIEHGCDVLLLPYPTSGLDVEAQVRVQEILVEEAERGTTVLFASGELDELFAVCDRIVVMNRGHAVGEQSRGEFDAEQLVSWFIAGEGQSEEVAQ